MKKVLVYFCVAFLLSCSNSFITEEGKGKYLPATPQERAMFGYDLDLVHEKEVNIKVNAKDEADLDLIFHSLKKIGVQKQDVQKAFAEGEYFINAKVIGDYPEALKKIRAMSEVIYADPNYKVVFANEWKSSLSDAIVHPFSLEEGDVDSDPIADKKEYALAITEALRAYQEFGIGEHKIWAGIIDTGTNANHEDLQHPDGIRVVQVLKTAFGNGGQIENVDSGNSDDEPNYGGHGTHCSGTICAVGNNKKGIAGVAWKNVMLASYKGLTRSGGSIYKLYAAFKDLIDTVRAREGNTKQSTIPVNFSLGAPVATCFELEHINYSMSNGALLVAANGNEGQMLPSYPASFPGVLAVGATAGDDKKIGFSTTGPWINVCAPGVDIISLGHHSNSEYVYMSGTSMATPFVTGLVAYLLTFNPKIEPMQMIALLEKTADKVDAMNRDPLGKYDAKGFSKWYGYGRVNVYRAAKAVKENKVPKIGDVYVETKIIVKPSSYNLYNTTPIYIYDKSTGALITVTLATGSYPSQAEIRGLRAGTYRVVYNGNAKEVTIDNTRDVIVDF